LGVGVTVVTVVLLVLDLQIPEVLAVLLVGRF
jgi:hypothetical protein